MMSSIAVSFIFLFSLLNASLQYDIFWSSAKNGIYVVDNVFKKNSSALRALKMGLTQTAWSFTVDEAGSGSSFKVGFRTKHLDGRFKALSKLKRIGKALYGNASLVGGEGRIIERGDFSPVVENCAGSSSFYRLILILTQNVAKNDYGEIVIYDDNEEIIKSVHSKTGRAIFLPCRVKFKIAPPSINVKLRHYYFLSEFGEEDQGLSSPAGNKQLVDETGQPLQDQSMLLSSFLNKKIAFNVSDYEIVDPEKYLKRRFHSSDGRKIHVYDNAVPSRIVDAVGYFVTNHADYFEDVDFESSADNVKWIISFDDPSFQESILWTILKRLLHHTAGKPFYSYDVTCNHVRRTDTTFVHKDIYENYNNTEEYTVLLYLNPTLTLSDYGETSFHEENGELIASILPKYGRVAIFDGKIDHSAHPSSPALFGARYTFAIKTAPSQTMALQRYFTSAGLDFDKILTSLRSLEKHGSSPEQRQNAATLLEKVNTGMLGDKDLPLVYKLLEENNDTN